MKPRNRYCVELPTEVLEEYGIPPIDYSSAHSPEQALGWTLTKYIKCKEKKDELYEKLSKGINVEDSGVKVTFLFNHEVPARTPRRKRKPRRAYDALEGGQFVMFPKEYLDHREFRRNQIRKTRRENREIREAEARKPRPAPAEQLYLFSVA